MPPRSRPVVRRVLLLAPLVAVALAVVLVGCGTEQESPGSASSASVGTVSENPSASVVGGPRPATPVSSVPRSTHIQGTDCGETRGPDGALEIVVLAGGVDCGTATKIAQEYGPKIATGQPTTVSGWQCGLADTAGVLATCTKGSDRIGFLP
ncbi:hypothetical protein [Gordonia soli]|uniref:Lipoprotein n=1 Tax=Gordonia soli NBRC 108243 TaxID=1223545 RepID=M0QJP9_9ACTN|nr:hypothetical protein [Gordonia soli]GAC67662.1 hypothetical protein GS4_08_02470 [Gordonia soli NBRC 108243]